MIGKKEGSTKNNVHDMQQWAEERIYMGVKFLIIIFMSKELFLVTTILNLNLAIIITWVERNDKIGRAHV